MLVKACDAIDILELNKKKEYTLTATCILESVLTNPNLNAQTVKLWQILFNRARFHSNLKVDISYNELAKKLHRSCRSISRYVRTLVQEGYLLVDENFSNDGSQRPNTLYIRIPSVVVEEVKNKKDRVVNKASFSSIDSGVLDTYSIEGSESPSNYQHNKIEDEINSVAADSMDTSSQTLSSLKKDITVSSMTMALNDKIDVGEDDKSDVHKDSIEKAIIKNNNVVDSIHSVSKSISSFEPTEKADQQISDNVLRETVDDAQDIQDQQEINNMESEISLLYVKLSKVKSTEQSTIFDKIRRLQATVTTINVLMKQRKQAKTLVNSSATLPIGIHNFIDLTMDFSKVTGERELSLAEMARIKRTIEKSPTYASNAKNVSNEIIYAVRFGSLRIAQNGEILSITHAVSIALKLLRENRWETPAPMKRKEKSKYHFKKRQTMPQNAHGMLESIRRVIAGGQSLNTMPSA